MNVHGHRTLTALALVGLLAAQAAWTAPFVELTNGQRVVGKEIRAKANGDIVLNRDEGPVTFTKAQVKRAVADKPDQMDAVVRAVQTGQYDKAIPVLEKLITDYRALYWDVVAMDQLGRAQAGMGKADEALKTYAKLARTYPDAMKGDAKWGYLQALIAAKKYTDAEKKLKEVIQTGSREDAALAQIMRGDARAAQGDREGAAINYLRTVILFKAVAEHQPQALYKAGVALDQMKDPRAKQQFQLLRQNYPDSPWAAKAKGKG